MHKRPLAVISVFFIIGIVLARFLPDAVRLSHVFVVTLIFILLCLLLALIHRRAGLNLPYGINEGCSGNVCNMFGGRGKAAHVFLFLSIISLGALLYLNSNIFPNDNIKYFLGENRIKAEIIGIIKSPAEARGVYYGKVSSRYVFEVETIANLSRSAIGQTSGGLALIRIQTEKDYQYGDRLVVKGTIKRPETKNIVSRRAGLPVLRSFSEGGNLPYGYSKDIVRAKSGTNFDYKQYLENRNIFAIINASEKNVTLLSHNYKSNPVLRFAYFVREKLKNQFLEKMPLESGAFLRAILLGDRSELPKKLNESFRNSGTMHILPTQCRV